MMNPFTPGGSATLAATTSSGRVALDTHGGMQVLIFSAGTAVTFIKFGDSTVTAAVTDIAIPSGFNRIFTIPPGATHVAGITGASTATVYFTRGDGQ
jgi:hypothetical protein